MKKTILISALLTCAYSLAVAAPVGAPPQMDSEPGTVATATSKKIAQPVVKEKTEQQKKEELDQARKDLDEAKVRSKNPSLWPKTKIEETVDNNNVVTEVKVTPMSTQIPYTMKREPPSNQTKGGSGTGDNTMSIPKFINFGF